MKKRILSLLCVLALCLGLLPVTALAAAAPSRQVIYVGNTNVTSGGYWTTDSNGNVTAYTEDGTTPSNNYIHYNKETNTLTLHNATIKESLVYNESNGDSTLIHSSAIGVLNQHGNAELTIQLEGSNTIAEVSQGIYVLEDSKSTSSSSLTIKGNGSLDTSSSQIGIRVQSNSSDAALSIKNAKVTATVVDGYGGNGVVVQSSENSSVSLTVNSGSLTATGRYADDAGILLQFGSGGSGSGSGTPTVTVSNNAIVRANGGITNTSSTSIQYGTGNEENGGIIWNGTEGTVYSEVELQEDLEIGEGECLTIGDEASLNTGSHEVIVNGGTLTGGERITGTVKYAPTITTQPTSQTVTEGGTATFTVVTSGTEPLSYQWQQSTDSGQSWADIGGATDATYTTEATTTSMNGYQYRCVVSNSAGSITSDAVSLTVNEHVHTWGNPVWSWSEDGKTCTVTFTCEKDENHKESPKVDVTSAVKKPATCTETGVTTYTATVEFNGNTYTDTKEVADLPAIGHSYGKPVWNWSEDGKTCTVTFTCEKDETHKETPKVIVTSAEKTPGTCTETGVTTYTATVEFNGQTYTDTKDLTDIPATGHSYENGKCTVCGAIASDFKAVITAGANGTWQKGTKDGLSFTSNAAYKHFQKVQVDGKDLDVSNYTVKEGSTIVTLKTSYLETLSVGKHTLAIVSETGTATTEFTVKAAAVTDDTQSPQTGDDSNIALWIAVLLAAGTALTGTAVYSRKRKYSK